MSDRLRPEATSCSKDTVVAIRAGVGWSASVVFSATIVAFLVLLLVSLRPAVATVTALSTDGEATIYLPGDFSGEFSVAYRVLFDAASANRSWSVVDISLLGFEPPSGSVTIGLARGANGNPEISAFRTSGVPNEQPKYEAVVTACTASCVLEIRGDLKQIVAVIGTEVVETWQRDALSIKHPYIQINGEVSAIGDTIEARLIPVRVIASGKNIHPVCGFTTQGVEPQLNDGNVITFSGFRKQDARVTYLSLINGITGDSCPAITPVGENVRPDRLGIAPDIAQP